MAYRERFANIGTSPQDIPLNQMLGRMAFQDVPSGILQVVQYNRTDQIETSFASDTMLMAVTITPKQSGSLFMIMGNCGGCGSRGTGTTWEMKLTRDVPGGGSAVTLMYPSTYIGALTGSGFEAYPSFNWIDRPEKDKAAIMYKLTGYRTAGTDNCYFHHSNGSLDSTMTVIELAGIPYELQNNQSL